MTGLKVVVNEVKMTVFGVLVNKENVRLHGCSDSVVVANVMLMTDLAVGLIVVKMTGLVAMLELMKRTCLVPLYISFSKMLDLMAVVNVVSFDGNSDCGHNGENDGSGVCGKRGEYVGLITFCFIEHSGL